MARGKVEGKVSKRKMVEEAMSALGEAKPGEMQEYITKHHGVEISAQMISSYKSNIKRTGGGAAGGRVLGPDTSIGLRDLATIRDLMSRVGPAQLQALIKMLAR